MLFYYIPFLLSIFSLYISSGRFKYTQVLVYCLAFVLIIIAGFRKSTVDNDYLAYASLFKDIDKPLNYFTNYSSYYFLEPAYFLIPSVIKNVFGAGIVWVFVVFAALGISFKFRAILKLTDFPFLSIAVYVIHYYLLHEFTQIRSGIVSGLLLLSVPAIYAKQKYKFLLITLFALCFHYMAIFLLPLYFLNPSRINKLKYYLLLIIPFIFYMAKIDIFSILALFNLGVFTEKLTFYQGLLDEGLFTKINIFNVITLIQLTLCCIFIYKADYLSTKNKYSLILIKIYVISQSVFILFATMPVFAFRISGLYEIVQIIVLPFLIYIFTPRYVAISIIFAFCLLLLSVNLFHSNLLKPYF